MFSGTYPVAERERKQLQENNQCYKNCAITLLVFSLLCIIIIAISWPFKGQFPKHETSKADSLYSSEQYRGSPRPLETTTDGDIEIISSIAPMTGIQKDLSPSAAKYLEFEKMWKTTIEFRSTIHSRDYETTPGSETITPTYVDGNTMKKIDETIFISSTTQADNYYQVPAITREQSPPISPSQNLPFDDFKTTAEYYHNEKTITPTEEIALAGIKSTTDEFHSTTGAENFTSLKRLLVARYFGNESSTKEILSMDNWLDDVNTTPTSEYKNSNLTHSSIGSSSTSKSITAQHFRDFDFVDEICTGRCKQKVSKMLSWMNHSADPCDDFYEFACGGLDADPEMIVIHPEERALSIIKKQMIKEKEKGGFSLFYDYYQRCVDYGKYSIEEKQELIKEIMNELGKASHQSQDSIDPTKLIIKSLQHNRPFLFDITVDVDEFNSQKFILKIGPSLPNIFSAIFKNDDSCDSGDNQEASVDLYEMYEKYKLCKNNTNELSNSSIGISHASNDSSDGKISLDFIKALLSDLPPEIEIREAYRSKNYTLITLSDLQNQSALLKWPQLILKLTGVGVSHNTKLQVYFKDHLFRALRKIDDYGLHDLLQFNNAILSIYADNLYNEMIQADFSRDLENKCLKITASLLSKKASTLYISAFTYDHLNDMKSKVTDIFKQLKQTLKLKFEDIHWVSPTGRDVLIKKLDDIQISIPELSSFKESDDNKALENNNFILNTMHLMKKQRVAIYSVFNKKPNTPEILWTHFATAFQPLAQTLHTLNLILVPLGVLEALKFIRNNEKYDYTTLASVGNLLAHELAHYFNANGIHYWNGTRDSFFPLLNDHNFTLRNYDNYVNCQSDEIFQYPTAMTIPGSNQFVKLTIPSHTLNERLSDAMGVRLAHDTLDRLGPVHVKPIPWLDLNVDQLFYLAYAQTHCTKAPLTASSISLYENPQLPGRLRVYAAAINNKRIGEVFRCAEGSQLLPAFSCGGVFPYIEISEVPVPAA